MADHDVSFTIPKRKLKRADIEFSVRRSKQPFGTLLVSEGGLEWVPPRKQKGTKIWWKELAAFAQSKA